MSTTSPAALLVEHLEVRFGERAILDGLTLRADAGRITGILGPNGAGKTTLVRCCAGLLRPSGGSIRVLGAVPGSPLARAKVGMMPQSTGAWSGVKPAELLRYLASLYAHPLNVDQLINQLGIAEFRSTPYRRLSGGQQQSVNLAGALIGRPELVFLDEPTAGMDPHARRATWSLLTELRDCGVSVLLTTHAMDEAEKLADQIFIMDRGRVSIAGTVAELTHGGCTLEDVFLSHTTARTLA